MYAKRLLVSNTLIRVTQLLVIDALLYRTFGPKILKYSYQAVLLDRFFEVYISVIIFSKVYKLTINRVE
jgi:hypothetical protein